MCVFMYSTYTIHRRISIDGAAGRQFSVSVSVSVQATASARAMEERVTVGAVMVAATMRVRAHPTFVQRQPTIAHHLRFARGGCSASEKQGAVLPLLAPQHSDDFPRSLSDPADGEMMSPIMILVTGRQIGLESGGRHRIDRLKETLPLVPLLGDRIGEERLATTCTC